jgi:hypothetical protein
VLFSNYQQYFIEQIQRINILIVEEFDTHASKNVFLSAKEQYYA